MRRMVLKDWLLIERTLKLGSGNWIKTQDKIAFFLILLCVIHNYKIPSCWKVLAAWCFCSVISISFTYGFYWNERIKARTWLLLFHRWWRITVEKYLWNLIFLSSLLCEILCTFLRDNGQIFALRFSLCFSRDEWNYLFFHSEYLLQRLRYNGASLNFLCINTDSSAKTTVQS